MIIMALKRYIFYTACIQSIGPLKAHCTLPPGRPVHSDTNSSSLGSILAMLQLPAKIIHSYFHHHLQPGAHLYSLANWASCTEWKCPNFEMVANGIRTRALSIACPEFYRWATKIRFIIGQLHLLESCRSRKSVTSCNGNLKSSSSSRSHLVVRLSSSQFCHGLHLLSFRWHSCPGWHGQSISASVFLAFFSQVHLQSFFRHSLGLASWRVQTTSILLYCTSLWCYLSPWCHRFSHGLLVCGCIPTCTS